MYILLFTIVLRKATSPIEYVNATMYSSYELKVYYPQRTVVIIEYIQFGLSSYDNINLFTKILQ